MLPLSLMFFQWLSISTIFWSLLLCYTSYFYREYYHIFSFFHFTEMAALIEKTEIYKKYSTRFSTKLYELVPENCQCPRVMEDIPKDSSEQRIIVMKEKLPNLSYTRSGNRRDVQMTIYCVRDTDGTVCYCIYALCFEWQWLSIIMVIIGPSIITILVEESFDCL